MDKVSCRVRVVLESAVFDVDILESSVSGVSKQERQVRAADVGNLVADCGTVDLLLWRDEPGAKLPGLPASSPVDAAGWRIGSRLRRLPPLDLEDLSWAEALPALPGVDVSWLSIATNTPFGDVVVRHEVKDGRVVSVGQVDPSASHDVWFRFEGRRTLLQRAGDLLPAEVLGEDPQLGGDLESVLMVAGLLETTEWADGRRLDPADLCELLLLYDLSDAGLFPRIASCLMV